MSLTAEEIAFATDLFADLPDLTTRRMFGGLGLYSRAVIFAVMRSDGQVLLKARPGPFLDRLRAAGSTPWTYTRKNGTPSAMPYWTLPDAALDDPETARHWARDALADLT